MIVKVRGKKNKKRTPHTQTNTHTHTPNYENHDILKKKFIGTVCLKYIVKFHAWRAEQYLNTPELIHQLLFVDRP
jgi:hypothetical protein